MVVHFQGRVTRLFGDVSATRAVSLPAWSVAVQSVARAAAAAAHPFDPASTGDAAAAAPFRTLIHGDTKAANLFIRPRKSDDAATEVEVGLIDFQFAGFGLAATDIAHLVCAALDHAACGMVVERGIGEASSTIETALLDGYWISFTEASSRFGGSVGGSYTRETFQQQYESGVLDMCRVVFAHQWGRAKFGEANLNRNAYNKLMPSAVWLVVRCDAILKARGV